MKIIQITVSSYVILAGTAVEHIYGLGDDGKVYFWSAREQEWQLKSF